MRNLINFVLDSRIAWDLGTTAFGEAIGLGNATRSRAMDVIWQEQQSYDYCDDAYVMSGLRAQGHTF